MKKLYSILLTVFILLSVTACANGKSSGAGGQASDTHTGDQTFSDVKFYTGKSGNKIDVPELGNAQMSLDGEEYLATSEWLDSKNTNSVWHYDEVIKIYPNRDGGDDTQSDTCIFFALTEDKFKTGNTWELEDLLKPYNEDLTLCGYGSGINGSDIVTTSADKTMFKDVQFKIIDSGAQTIKFYFYIEEYVDGKHVFEGVGYVKKGVAAVPESVSDSSGGLKD